MRLWYAAAVGSLSMLPFLAVHLSKTGLGDGGAAWTLMALPLGTLFGGPLWAIGVDRLGKARLVHRLALFGTMLAVLGLGLVDGIWASVLLVVGFAFSRSGIFPLADAATLHAVGSRYGIVRGIGSLGYIAGLLVIGATRAWFPESPLVVGAVLLGAATVLAGRLPPLPHLESSAGTLALLRDRTRLTLLGIAVLNGLSITAYDHLFALHMERAGIPPHWTSLAIAWGVLVEVVVMVQGPRWFSWASGRVLLLVAVASGVPRFALTAWLAHPLAVGLLQGLHGLQFGLFWIVSVHLIGETAPPAQRRSVQALLPAAGFGVAPLTILLVGGGWLQTGSTRSLFAALVVPALLATLLAVRLLQQPVTSSPSSR